MSAYREVVCFRCDHVFEVAGEVPDLWYCPACIDDIASAASEPSYPTAGPSERERWEQAADCGRRDRW